MIEVWKCQNPECENYRVEIDRLNKDNKSLPVMICEKCKQEMRKGFSGAVAIHHRQFGV